MGTLNLNEIVRNAVKTATDLVGTQITIVKVSQRNDPLASQTSANHQVDAVMLSEKVRRVASNTSNVSGSTIAGNFIEGLMGGAVMRADQGVEPTDKDFCIAPGAPTGGYKIVSVDTINPDGDGNLFYKILWEL